MNRVTNTFQMDIQYPLYYCRSSFRACIVSDYVRLLCGSTQSVKWEKNPISKEFNTLICKNVQRKCEVNKVNLVDYKS